MISSKYGGWVIPLLVFLTLLGAVVSLQWYKGAFVAEFSGSADEPAHYVTGLLAHDYLAAGAPWPPMAYAENYYRHYPKVAIGHWPPFFYMVQAAWMLGFGVSRLSMMLLMASLTALLGTVVFQVARREFGVWTGVAVVILVLTAKPVAISSMLVMAEILLTLLILLALLAFARYLEHPAWQSAAWFGLWAGLALLTKGTGIVLAAVPPIAVALTGRWGLLRKFSLWLPAVIVVVMAGPWYLLVPGAKHEKVFAYGEVQIIPSRFWGSVESWADSLGIVVTLAAILGVAVAARMIHRRQANGLWITSVAVLIGTLLCRQLVGAWEARHLVAGIPMLLLLAALGVKSLRERISAGPEWLKTGVLVAAVLLLAVWDVGRIPRKAHRGFSETVDSLLADASRRDQPILVCSGSTGEGVVVAEVAMREKRPGRVVLRGSKVLAEANWMGTRVRTLFDDREKMLAAVEAIPVGAVVLDRTGLATPYCQMLLDGVNRHPEKWRHAPPAAGSDQGRGIQVFLHSAPPAAPARPVQSQASPAS